MAENPSLRELVTFVGAATQQYRTGPEVQVADGVVHVYAMPPDPGRGVLVDVHFVKIGFTEAAADKPRFVQLLAAALAGHGQFRDIPPDRFARGPSYIEIGGWIGDQGLALCLMALGVLYELWDVLTPERLGITGPEADELAGGGMVLIAPRPGLLETLTGR